MFNLGGKTRLLQEELDALKNEIGPLRVDRERIRKELGVERASEIISMVRELETKVAELSPTPASEEEGDNPLAGLSDPKQVLLKIRQFTGKIESLNGTVASMEEQLGSMYEDKERLEREIGASEVEDVLEGFRHLQTTIGSMESQLMTMYAAREHLEVELGDSDPRSVVRRFKIIAQLMRGMESELGDTVLSNLSTTNGVTNGVAGNHSPAISGIPSNGVYFGEGSK
ncbi:MAG: hypothetical protein H7145_23100 [Akkermansiaceae bacterium]|nr:hypothetical protein [Armatimonadota bacterium]